MSEEEKEVSAVGFGARRPREKQLRPDKWSPGVRVASGEEYNRFTDQLAGELLTTCTPEHLAVISAQHMMYANELKCLLEEARALAANKIDAKAAVTLVTAAMEEAAARAASEIGRHAANAKHAPGKTKKEKALDAWEAFEPKHRRQAHFARNRYKEFGVTERTLGIWISEHENSKPKT